MQTNTEYKTNFCFFYFSNESGIIGIVTFTQKEDLDKETHGHDMSATLYQCLAILELNFLQHLSLPIPKLNLPTCLV